MRSLKLRKLTVTALLAAIATVLMFLSFNVPFFPSFLKMDFSELPALIASFAIGPLSGVVVCFIKNLINLFFSKTLGIGEISNFIIGCFFVLPAGLIYKKFSGKRGALIGSLAGAVSMAIISVFTNYYIVYPLFSRFMYPMEAILGMYQAINPDISNLWVALFIFNMPFTFLKGIINVIICFFLYKNISPLIRGDKA